MNIKLNIVEQVNASLVNQDIPIMAEEQTVFETWRPFKFPKSKGTYDDIL
jgi:hypothetical protein